METAVKANVKGKKFAWYDLSKQSEEQLAGLLDALMHSHYEGLIMTPDQAADMPTGLKKIGFFNNEARVADVMEVAELYQVLLLENELFDRFQEEELFLADVEMGVLVRVTDMPTLELACHYLRKAPYVVVDFKDETKIPLELVLAEAQHLDVNVITRVNDGLEAEVVFGVLEMGSHGILFGSPSVEEVMAVGAAIEGTTEAIKQELSVLTVLEIKHIGMGERACIDTCTYLGLDEGILIGSFSRGGVLVCSETHPLPYMPLRPFRVNAGALHSYALAPDNRTWYLSDLEAGMELLAVKTDGTARRIPVGRIKIEKRPLLMIRVQADSGEEMNIILQEDWHVRVFGADGKPRNVTTLKPNEKLLGYVQQPGRHVGIAVDEWILEK